MPVGLTQATATFSQSNPGDFSVGHAVDGVVNDDLGWAIHPNEGLSQTAVFETVTDVGFAGGTLLNFTISQYHAGTLQHLLGRFRVSITTDDRNSFADGLPVNGAVTANWTVLGLTSLSSAGGATLTVLPGDGSVLVSGTLSGTDTYTFSTTTGITGITGIRLEAIADPSLPGNGPGRFPGNGNFVVSEFAVTVTAIPEPSAWAAFAGTLALGLALRRRASA